MCSEHLLEACGHMTTQLTTLQRSWRDHCVTVHRLQMPCQTSPELSGILLEGVYRACLSILQEEVVVYAFFLYKGAVGVASLLKVVAARL